MYMYTHAHTQLCLTLCDRQAPQSMAFFSPEYWSGLPIPSPGYLLDPGIESTSLTSPALAVGFFTS